MLLSTTLLPDFLAVNSTFSGEAMTEKLLGLLGASAGDFVTRILDGV